MSRFDRSDLPDADPAEPDDDESDPYRLSSVEVALLRDAADRYYSHIAYAPQRSEILGELLGKLRRVKPTRWGTCNRESLRQSLKNCRVKHQPSPAQALPMAVVASLPSLSDIHQQIADLKTLQEENNRVLAEIRAAQDQSSLIQSLRDEFE
jgi:hypothetical protein